MKKRSLQWQVTLITTVLMVIACLTISYIISISALGSMDDIGDSVISIIPNESFYEEVQDGEDFSLGISVEEMKKQIADTRVKFWQGSILVTVIVTLVGSTFVYFFVGHLIKPLRQLNEKIDEIQAKNLKEIDLPESSKELTKLKESFNEMMARLEEAFEVQRQFSASAAHELRTPIAVMQTKIDVFKKQAKEPDLEYDEVLSMIEKQIGSLSHVIDILLEMTELNSVRKSDEIPVEEVVEEVFCDLAAAADQKEIELIQKPGNAKIMGNDVLIYRALYNLVENAIKYGRTGGKVEVAVEAGDDTVRILVQDDGIGIPPEHRENIFRPFYRVDKSRSREMGGAGLGLALVYEIAKQHGGRVYVEESTEGNTRIVFEV